MPTHTLIFIAASWILIIFVMRYLQNLQIRNMVVRAYGAGFRNGIMSTRDAIEKAMAEQGVETVWEDVVYEYPGLNEKKKPVLQ